MLQYGGGQGGGGFGQKAGDVMVGKVLSVTTSLTAKECSAVEQIWQDWREGNF